MGGIVSRVRKSAPSRHQNVHDPISNKYDSTRSSSLDANASKSGCTPIQEATSINDRSLNQFSAHCTKVGCPEPDPCQHDKECFNANSEASPFTASTHYGSEVKSYPSICMEARADLFIQHDTQQKNLHVEVSASITQLESEDSEAVSLFGVSQHEVQNYEDELAKTTGSDESEVDNLLSGDAFKYEKATPICHSSFDTKLTPDSNAFLLATDICSSLSNSFSTRIDTEIESNQLQECSREDAAYSAPSENSVALVSEEDFAAAAGRDPNVTMFSEANSAPCLIGDVVDSLQALPSAQHRRRLRLLVSCASVLCPPDGAESDTVQDVDEAAASAAAVDVDWWDAAVRRTAAHDGPLGSLALCCSAGPLPPVGADGGQGDHTALWCGAARRAAWSPGPFTVAVPVAFRVPRRSGGAADDATDTSEGSAAVQALVVATATPAEAR